MSHDMRFAVQGVLIRHADARTGVSAEAPARARTTEGTAAVLAHREATCRRCRHFEGDWDRCGHPNCGCPHNDAIRVAPWAALRHCPARRW